MNSLKSLVRLARAMRDPSVPVWVKFLPLAALVYFVMPIDVVPDPIPILGWLDDVLVVVALISQAARQVDRQKALPSRSAYLP